MTMAHMQRDTEREIGRKRFTRHGRTTPVDPLLVATRDDVNGEIRLHITLPNVQGLVFPHDLGVVLQSIGWGIWSLGFETGFMPTDFSTIIGTSEVVQKVEYALRLE